MLKLTFAAVVAALLTPALAHAGTVRGTVVAKQMRRDALVIATSHRDAMSVRVSPGVLRRTRLGARLLLTGRRLADGSLQVSHQRQLGRVGHARLHVVVIRASARQLLVAGGGSAFSVRLSRRTRQLASAGGFQPGEEIETDVAFSDGQAVGLTVQPTGQAPLIDFSGVVTATGASSFTVSADGVPTMIQLPAGVVLPSLVQVGSEVEVVAALSGSSLTLTMVKLDGPAAEGNGGSSVDEQNAISAEGFVTALDAGSVTIQPGDAASPVTFALPDGFTLPSGLIVGSIAEARGTIESGVLTLTRIELKGQEGDQTELEAEGTVTALDSGSITIQSGDGGGDGATASSITFTIPDGFTLPAGLAVGSTVDAKGALANGTPTLSEIELQRDGGGSSGGDG